MPWWVRCSERSVFCFALVAEQLFPFENICHSCPNTSLDSQLKEVARAASNGNIVWPHFSLLREREIWICWHFQSQIYHVCVLYCSGSLFFSIFTCWCGLYASSAIPFSSAAIYAKLPFGDCQVIFWFRCSLFLCIFLLLLWSLSLWTESPGLVHNAFFPLVVMCMWFEAYNLVIFKIWEAQVIYFLSCQIHYII